MPPKSACLTKKGLEQTTPSGLAARSRLLESFQLRHPARQAPEGPAQASARSYSIWTCVRTNFCWIPLFG